MKIRLTVYEAEKIACALCFAKMELEAHAHAMDIYTEERRKTEESALFYEQMCNRFLYADEKSQGGGVTIDIE